MSQEARLKLPKEQLPAGAEHTAKENPKKLSASNVNFYYGEFKALHDITLDVKENQITALIGPSGCGKSTFLRTLNRMHETVRGTRLEGEIRLDGEDILALDPTTLRRRIGM